MSNTQKASCLCGAVKFQATPEKLEMGVCHCSMCRKWSGGTFMAVSCKDVSFEDAGNLKVYQSSQWGERVFCEKCGSTLMWRMQDKSHSVVSAQAFDDPSVFEFTGQIFVDEKPDNYEFSNKTNNMTAAEVMAMFAPKEGE